MSAENLVTPSEVAQWMLAELERRGRLDRDVTVCNIEQIFGHEFISDNEKGHPTIRGGVMKAFWRLAENAAFWDAKNRAWVKLETQSSSQKV
jgi:hypothetical protein